MSYYKKLEGERIYLSPPDPEDAEIYTGWMNDFRVSEGLGNASHVISEAGEQIWLEEDASEYQFSIIRMENDQLIGHCSIENVDFLRRRAGMGIYIGDEENRGKGYGQEAIRLLLTYAFEYLNLNNIMLGLWSFNTEAYECYKKAGFKEIGRRRECYYLKGVYYDEILMDILQKDWFERKKTGE